MDALHRIQEYRLLHGTKYTITRLGQKAVQRIFGTYDRRWKRERCSPGELEHQRRNPPPAGLLSVVIPVYNTDPAMLSALLDTLAAQSYANFEAVLYDGCSNRPETLSLLRGLTDPRFRVIRGEENRGISGNTNAAIRLARGEYVALCDHDDLLAPDALWRAAEAICRDHPDLIYSDEDRITQSGRHHMDPHYKPDYCPDNLISDNYLCHLAVIRKSLLEEIGGLRSGFDGSQDHDLFLRLAEKTDRITHLPYVLYSWREVFSSMSHRNLQLCLENGCRAVEEHEARMGRPVSAVPVHKEIRLWYDIDPAARIEALVHGENEEDCHACLGELAFLTGWGALTGAVICADGADRWRLINEAATSSRADYLLVMESGVGGMNRHFLRELLMYAQREDVAGATPALLDRKRRITHGGFAVGMASAAQCVNESMVLTAGGWHDMMNKVHNVSAVSVCCFLVKRSCWMDLDTRYRGGLVSVDLGLRQMRAGRRWVFTPHATALRDRDPLLLSGKARDPEDLERFRNTWGDDPGDPCYSPRFDKSKACYRF